MTLYRFPNLKLIRSREIVKEYLINRKGCEGIFILSCGNAYHSLNDVAKKFNIKVIGLSTSHDYGGARKLENRFYSKVELEALYPNYFDATPGALGDELTCRIGAELYLKLRMDGYCDEKLYVPIGSGETIQALSRFIPAENLVGFTCEDYPPIHLDYSLLKEKVEGQFKIEKLRELREIFSAAYSDSILVTW